MKTPKVKDRDVFESGRLKGTDIFEPPKVVKEDIKKRNWAFRWLNRRELASNGGFDPRGWRPYLLPHELRKSREPGEYGEDVIANPDGTICRIDLVLCIRPMAMHKQARKEAFDEAKGYLKMSQQTFKDRGIEVDEESVKKFSRIKNDEILKE